MEETVPFFLMAIVAAFVAGRSAARVVSGLFMRRAASLGEGASLWTLALWRLRNGVRWSMRAGRVLLRWQWAASLIDECALMLAKRDMDTSREALASLVVAWLVLSGMAGAFLSGNAACAVLMPICELVFLLVYASSSKEKRTEFVRESLPTAIDSMSTCFGVGYTLLQTFRQVAKETPGPVGELFHSASNVLDAGGSVEEALEVLEGGGVSEIAFVAAALDIQHQTGGSMRQVLDAVADSVKGELSLKRSLRVQTAQAKLSARIVAAMPVVLVTMFSVASPTFLSPFFQSAAGLTMLLVAVVMQVAGVFMVKRALNVEGAI